MSSVYRRCCGIDIHKETAVVCVLPPDGEEGKIVIKRFGTLKNELSRFRGWLKLLRVTDIVIESTGVYWIPVWNMLEGHDFTLVLANAGQVKALHGRKSDNRDCQRLAQFLQDRRLDGSFVPPAEIRQLRQMLRHRRSLLEQRNEVHNQIRDLLETANIKLSSVVSDLMGVSGQRILKALAGGLDSPEQLSWKARGTLRAKERQIREALKNTFTEFHRRMLEALLRHYEFLTAQIALFEAHIGDQMVPYQEQVQLLSTIPGVDRIAAWGLIAELGVDMSVFPTAAHCASWAGLAPGTHESAGKLLSGATKKGNKFLRRLLVQAAWANTRCKQGYLKAFFHRIKARRGWSKAIIAVAHKILVFAYSILKDKQPYLDLGQTYFDQLNPDKALRRMLERIDRLGFSATIVPKEQPAP